VFEFVFKSNRSGRLRSLTMSPGPVVEIPLPGDKVKTGGFDPRSPSALVSSFSTGENPVMTFVPAVVVATEGWEADEIRVIISFLSPPFRCRPRPSPGLIGSSVEWSVTMFQDLT
jgi:hypothetical protein